MSLPKLNVEGSSPFSRSISLALNRLGTISCMNKLMHKALALPLLLLVLFAGCSDSSSSAPLTLQEAKELEEVLFFGGGADFGNPLDGGLGYTKDKQEALWSLLERSTKRRETYNSGQVKSEGRALNDGTKVWLWKTWHENGQLEIEGHYKGGWPEGRWKFYFENGRTRYYGNYKFGERVGEWTSYALEHEHPYGLILEDGRLALWSVETETTEDGGTITSQGFVDSHSKGVRLSEWVSRYESGQIYAEGLYIDGNRSGMWTWWNEDGSVMTTEQFD